MSGGGKYSDISTRLDTDAILAKLQTSKIGKSLLVLDQCTSTNDVASKFAGAAAPHGFAVIANEQTRGRGRYDRAWESPPGGIWMTIVLKSPLESHTLQELTVIGAIAIARGIVSSVGVEARVRWPNDVVVGERKLAGVLAESKLRGNRLAFALLGMGINANFHSFPVDGADKQPISLLDTVGSPIDRASVIASILLEVEQLLDRSRMDGEEPIMRMLRMSEASIGRHVRIELADHSICQGIIEEYESLTGLRILTRTGEHRTLDASSVLSVVYQD